MGTPKKLMVMIKLPLEDAMKIRWLDDSKPGKPWKARLRSVALADGTKLDVDSTNVTESIVPVKGKDELYDVFFMGYWEIPAGHADQAKVAGRKGEQVTYEVGLVDPATNAWAEVGVVYEVVEQAKTATLSAMG